MYDKECGILYAERTKEELRADLESLKNQKNEIKHHIEYVKSMLNKFRCVEFQKCYESDIEVVLSNGDLKILNALILLATKKNNNPELDIDDWECDLAELLFENNHSNK